MHLKTAIYLLYVALQTQNSMYENETKGDWKENPPLDYDCGMNNDCIT